jgi:hypothetical protein
MEMSKNDWRAYASYLQSQINMSELRKPSTIGEAYNNHSISQDLEDVNNNKIYVKAEA